MTAKQLLTLAHRLETYGHLVGDRDQNKAWDLANECRARAQVRELFERAGLA